MEHYLLGLFQDDYNEYDHMDYFDSYSEPYNNYDEEHEDMNSEYSLPHFDALPSIRESCSRPKAYCEEEFEVRENSYKVIRGSYNAYNIRDMCLKLSELESRPIFICDDEPPLNLSKIPNLSALSFEFVAQVSSSCDLLLVYERSAIPVNSGFLRKNSTYFERKLGKNWLRDRHVVAGKYAKVAIMRVDFSTRFGTTALVKILRWIYRGHVEISSLEEGMQIFELLDFLGLEKFLGKCESWLNAKICLMIRGGRSEVDRQLLPSADDTLFEHKKSGVEFEQDLHVLQNLLVFAETYKLETILSALKAFLKWLIFSTECLHFRFILPASKQLPGLPSCEKQYTRRRKRTFSAWKSMKYWDFRTVCLLIDALNEYLGVVQAKHGNTIYTNHGSLLWNHVHRHDRDRKDYDTATKQPYTFALEVVSEYWIKPRLRRSPNLILYLLNKFKLKFVEQRFLVDQYTALFKFSQKSSKSKRTPVNSTHGQILKIYEAAILDIGEEVTSKKATKEVLRLRKKLPVNSSLQKDLLSVLRKRPFHATVQRHSLPW